MATVLDPIVDLSPGAEENELATFFASALRNNLRTSRRAQKSFSAMRATAHFVAVDTTESVTMRFDHGRVTLHEGTIGIPAVTFCGDRDCVAGLVSLPLSPVFGLPLPSPVRPRDLGAFREVYRHLAGRRLIVYGFFSHPRLVTRILRVLSSAE